MKRKLTLAASHLLVLIAATAIASAQTPFAGTWKLDQSKSQLAGDTIKFGKAASDSIELTAGGTKYSFRADGESYRMASGDLAKWKQVDANTWTTDYMKPDGKSLYKDTWHLASDGKSLSVVTGGTKPNGETFSDEENYARTGGTDGLLGSWKSTKVKLSSPNELSIQSYGLAGLILKIDAMKATCLANFGGKDAIPTGPNIPHGLTLAIARTGPTSFHLIEKMNGSAMYSAQYTVSTDGKTMTEVGNSPGDPAQTAVWVKQ